MGGEFYKIPPALRATSLFKGGFRANNVRPYGEVVYLFEKERGDVGIAPYEIPLP